MSTPSKYEIRPLCAEDYDQVVFLLNNSFFRDEPLAKCLQVTETLQFAKNTVEVCIKQQCSFVAWDTETNQIIGACLNEVCHRSVREQEVNEPNEQVRFILQLFTYMHNKLDVFDRLKSDTLFHVFILSVDKVARGHGLASRLIGKSIERARDLQLKGAYAEASNVYSLNCFKQQQFEVIDEVKYTEYNPERLDDLKGPMYDRCYFVARSIQ